jgi:hypothetical protein
MATARHASHRMDALERRIAELEARSQPLGKTCPECHAFGLERYVLRTAFGGQGLQMMRCRFCAFAEAEMPASASSLPRAPSAAKDGGPAVNSQERRSAAPRRTEGRLVRRRKSDRAPRGCWVRPPGQTGALGRGANKRAMLLRSLDFGKGLRRERLRLALRGAIEEGVNLRRLLGLGEHTPAVTVFSPSRSRRLACDRQFVLSVRNTRRHVSDGPRGFNAIHL